MVALRRFLCHPWLLGAIEMKPGWLGLIGLRDRESGSTPVTTLEWLLIKDRRLCHHDPLALHDENSPRVCVEAVWTRLLTTEWW